MDVEVWECAEGGSEPSPKTRVPGGESCQEESRRQVFSRGREVVRRIGGIGRNKRNMMNNDRF